VNQGLCVRSAIFLGTCLMMWPAVASAQIIDDFSQTTAAHNNCAGQGIYDHSDSSAIGGLRSVYLRDSHNCSLSIRGSEAEFDAAEGEVRLFGGTAAGSWFSYGSAIGTYDYGLGFTSSATGSELNVNRQVDDSIRIDALMSDTPNTSSSNITLYANGEVYQNTEPLAYRGAGTIAISLFNFRTQSGIYMDAAAAADIDGIVVYTGVTSSYVDGALRLTQIRFDVPIIYPSLISQTVLAAGDANCAYGGVAIMTGPDNGMQDGAAYDGVLDPDEVTMTSYVCNGAPGADGQDGQDGADGADGQDGAPGADGQDGAPGAQGPAGADGQDGAPGADGADGQDGAPGADGQDGAPGADGVDGADGATSLLNVVDEPAGDNCMFGGVMVEAGLDADGSGVLEAEEVTVTQYVCNGADGAAGMDGMNGADGADGQDGASGADGADGEDGAPGAAGMDGADGEQGPEGPAGPAGPAGADGEGGCQTASGKAPSGSLIGMLMLGFAGMLRRRRKNA